MTDQRKFIESIRADPEDDVVRLVYADWLEEREQAGRAEFIRLECDVATFLKESKHRETCRCDGGNNLCTPCRDEDTWLEFSNRQWELLDILCDDFQLPEITNELGSSKGKGRDHDLRLSLTHYHGKPLDHSTYVLSRGFVEQVDCPIDWWISHGPALVRWHPVQRVELTDRQPWYRGVHAWLVQSPLIHDADTIIPIEVFNNLGLVGTVPTSTWYATREDAETARSNALIAWALEKLGDT